MDAEIKVREFLRTNLYNLEGEDLREFIERHEVREAGSVEMMILDMGMSGEFRSVAHPTKKNTHYVISAKMADKILALCDIA
jgi:hypothetical protein